jgi:folate-binding protein YgfZ
MTDERAALERLGARVSDRLGGPTVSSFGDPAAEAAALRGGAGLLPRPGQATWRASGTQALDYLHRMLTQDLRSLAPGAARRACALTREGRVLADLVAWNLGDAVLLDLDPRAAEKAMPPLERFVIADDVVFADATAERSRLVLCGPEAPAALRAAAGIESPGEGRFARAALGGAEALVLRRDLGDRPRLEVVVDRPALAGALAALAGAPGVVPVGEEAFDRARVETGVPAYGAEIDERILPNEAGLEDAISWTKGCYLGQEPVVMARHRGRPPTLLCRLSIEGPPPERDAELLLDGRRAGRVTTAVPDPSLPGSVALGFVRHDVARASARLALPSGAVCLVTSVLA